MKDARWGNSSSGRKSSSGARFLSAGNLSSEFLFGEEFVCGEFVFGIRVHKGIRLGGEFVFGWNGPVEGIHLGNSPSSSDVKCYAPSGHNAGELHVRSSFSICQLGKTE